MQFPDESHLSSLVVLSPSLQGVPIGANVVLGNGHFPVLGMHLPFMRHCTSSDDGSLSHVIPSHFGVPTQFPDESHLSSLVVSSPSLHVVPFAANVVSAGGHNPVMGMHVPCTRHWMLDDDGSLLHVTPSHLGVPTQFPDASHS